MQEKQDSARIRRGHTLSEEERAAVDEERETPDADREVDQPPKRSLRETRKREKGDRGADTSQPEQYEEFTGTEREPSQRKRGPGESGGTAG